MEKQKFKAFGQIQMIAKSLLTVCGIYAALAVAGYGKMGFYTVSCQTKVFNILYLLINLFVLCAIVFLTIINNDWLIRKILPTEEPIPAGHQKKWFVSSLRIGLVFCGLMLFASSAESIIETIKIIAGVLCRGRLFISEITRGDSLFAGAEKRRLVVSIFNILKAVLIAYLISGAPQFVKWQTKRTFTQGIQNE